MWRVTALIGLVIAMPAAAQEPVYRDRDYRVSDIQARLLYEESGSFSADVTDNPDLTLFNTIIGEGDARENTNDLLVTAVIQGPGEHNLTTLLTITARNEEGRVIASRRIPNMLAGERTYRSVALYDVGCAGVISLTAQLGTSSRTEEITLNCGE